LAALVALLVVAAAVWFLIELFQPFTGSGHGRIEVTIPGSSGAHEIGDLLARDGVVASGFFFNLRATIDGDRGKLLAGRHTFRLGMSYSAALKVLMTAPPAAKTTNVTIIPGHSRQQVDAILRRQHVRGSYAKATVHSRLLAPQAYGAPRDTPSLEGFLYPDTYQLRVPISIGALVADQLRTFKQRFRTVNFAYARSRHLTPYDVLIIASLLEEESLTPHDDPIAASVIYNRLADGMDLGLDSTVSYATGNYTGPLTVSELDSPSPWNTTNHRGLPPTPIDSPTLSDIEAAAHPARTNYLYFVNKVCGQGALAFTSNYQLFLKDSQAYAAAAHRKGGPEFCRG
jgi:UPF0755 protein